MSAFSDFIRNATPEEKARVYAEVIRKSEERIMRAAGWQKCSVCYELVSQNGAYPCHECGFKRVKP